MPLDDSPKPDRRKIYPKADIEPLDGPLEERIQDDPAMPWEGDPDVGGHSDPEHARRLAAIRTELLRRTQQRPPTGE